MDHILQPHTAKPVEKRRINKSISIIQNAHIVRTSPCIYSFQQRIMHDLVAIVPEEESSSSTSLILQGETNEITCTCSLTASLNLVLYTHVRIKKETMYVNSHAQWVLGTIFNLLSTMYNVHVHVSQMCKGYARVVATTTNTKCANTTASQPLQKVAIRSRQLAIKLPLNSGILGINRFLSV